MLNIIFGDFKERCIVEPNSFFNLNKKKEWFNDPYVKKIIKDIDNTIAVKDEYLESPIFGGMSPERLSSGCKCLIMLYKMDGINIYASRCGDNCSDYILDIAKNKDITITLHHLMVFNKDFEANILDTGAIVNNRSEYIDEYLKVKFVIS